MKRIWALRGATTITEDAPGEVISATIELLTEAIRVNRIDQDDIVSIIFTVTPDIRSEFPAKAARKLGLTDIPLMCAGEIDKKGALPLCIRIMIHFYTTLPKAEIMPVYLHNAVKLRPDLFPPL